MRFPRIHMGWWVLLGILVIGFWIQLSGYNTGLVITDVFAGDELSFYNEMLYRLEGGEALKKQYLIGYPPLIFVLNEAAHRLTADPSQPLLTPHALPTIALLKLWAVCANAATAVFLVLCSRILSGWRAGLAAALIWLILPIVIMRTVAGLTEAWQVCAITASSYFMLRAFSRGETWAAVASTATALVAFLFKFSIFPAFGLGIAVTLWHLWQTRRSPRRWIVTLVIQAALVGLGAVVLIQGITVEGAVLVQDGRETTQFLSGGSLRSLTNLSGILSVWLAAAAQLALPASGVSLLFILAMTALALIVTPVTWKRIGLILICGLALLHLALINGYLVFPSGIQRYTTPPSALWMLVITTSAVWVTQYMANQGWRRTGQGLFALGFLAWLLPVFQQSALAPFINTQPSTPEAYLRWVDSTLPKDAPLLIGRQEWLLFEYVHWEKKSTRVWYQGVISEMTRQEWLDKGISYVTITQYDFDQLSQTEAGKRELESMLRLKKFPRSGWAPENLYVYYLPTYEKPENGPVTFNNGMTLLGCRVKDVSEDDARRVRIQCLWQTERAQTTSWKLYVHVVPDDSRIPLAQADGTLLLPSRPPQTWTDPEEILIGQPYTIEIPQDVDMTSVKLLVGLYDEATGIRAQQNGSDYVEMPLPLELK